MERKNILQDEKNIVAYNETFVDDEEQPVTEKELKGWYLHNFACGAYDIAIAGFFAPVLLERLASISGYELDHVTPCNTKVQNHKCVINIAGFYIDTASFSFYVVSLSVLLQSILFISCSSLADHGANRKKFLLFFSTVGAFATICYALVIKPEWYWFASIITIVSNCCFGAAYVFHLAHIPIFSRIHSEVLLLKKSKAPREKLLEVEEKISTKLSVNTTSIGFVAGLLVVIGGLGIVLAFNSSDYSLQIAMSFGGGWWLFWLIFPLLWLKEHPEPPLPSTENKFLYPYKRFFKTIRTSSKLRQSMKFLISWFLLSDGINTIGPLAALFGSKTLILTEIQLLILAIVVPLCAAFGIYFFYLIEKLFKFTTKTMIVIISFLLTLLPAYTLLGFVLPFGMRNRWEIWLFAVYFGLCLGSVQAYSQSLFSRLIPKGHESEFFSIYLITAKGSSSLGPMLSGIIINATHEVRNGFWVLLVLLFLSSIVTLTVAVDKGIKESEDYVQNEIEEQN
ncbi:11065_t:CDS:2 [Funneliformis geosporum]|uniref:Autophagy-related protein n=1 Tax=Funneliformis geosporum TaxID=1117311 RepID=A0A9W4SEW1_9GLOM|nr:11065_t:CDS:2 [Funneliformis geosporum]CAI2166510.1 3530_t:CDS:2 [Funneliformis geosporum]